MVSCLKQRKREFISYPEVPKTRKKLCFSKQCTPTSFKLGNLHNHLLGVPPAQSHGAEADCLALLRSTAVLGIDWIMWVKDNCSLFSDCKKMWGWLLLLILYIFYNKYCITRFGFIIMGFAFCWIHLQASCMTLVNFRKVWICIIIKTKTWNFLSPCKSSNYTFQSSRAKRAQMGQLCILRLHLLRKCIASISVHQRTYIPIASSDI